MFPAFVSASSHLRGKVTVAASAEEVTLNIRKSNI